MIPIPIWPVVCALVAVLQFPLPSSSWSLTAGIQKSFRMAEIANESNCPIATRESFVALFCELIWFSPTTAFLAPSFSHVVVSVLWIGEPRVPRSFCSEVDKVCHEKTCKNNEVSAAKSHSRLSDWLAGWGSSIDLLVFLCDVRVWLVTLRRVLVLFVPHLFLLVVFPIDSLNWTKTFPSPEVLQEIGLTQTTLQ